MCFKRVWSKAQSDPKPRFTSRLQRKMIMVCHKNITFWSVAKSPRAMHHESRDSSSVNIPEHPSRRESWPKEYVCWVPLEAPEAFARIGELLVLKGHPSQPEVSAQIQSTKKQEAARFSIIRLPLTAAATTLALALAAQPILFRLCLLLANTTHTVVLFLSAVDTILPRRYIRKASAILPREARIFAEAYRKSKNINNIADNM